MSTTDNGWTPQIDQEVKFNSAATEFAGGVIDSMNERRTILNVDVGGGHIVQMPAEDCERGRGWRVHGTIPGATSVVKIHYGYDTRPVDEEDQRPVVIDQQGHPQNGRTARLMASENGKWVCKDDHTGEWLSPVEPSGLKFTEAKWAKFPLDKQATAISNKLYVNTREPERTIRRQSAG